jgi:hypothetical protein
MSAMPDSGDAIRPVDLPRDVAAAWETPGDPPSARTAAAAVDWLFDARRGQAHPAGRSYLSFLKSMYEEFHAIAEMYDLWSPPGSDGTKQSLRLIGPLEMLTLANHLYVLRAAGVEGCVLECGCSHGFSSCCLSRACAALGYRLVIADSFQGLPPTRPDEPFFSGGDYAASLEEVRGNVERLGRPAVVEYVPGWFSESLPGWRRELALLWLDVDLYESARDVLEHTFSSLNRRGALVTHEYTDFHGTPIGPGTRTVPGAIYERFEREQLTARTAMIMRYLGVFGFATSEGLESFRFARAAADRLAAMDHRTRAYGELRSSRTVRAAFALKKLLGIGRSAG